MLARFGLVVALLIGLLCTVLAPPPPATAATRRAHVAVQLTTPKGVAASVLLKKGSGGKAVRLVLPGRAKGGKQRVRITAPSGTYRVSAPAVVSNGVRYEGRVSRAKLTVSGSRTSAFSVRYVREPGARQLHATALTGSVVRLAWVGTKGSRYVLRRASGPDAPSKRTAGTAVKVQGTTARDARVEGSTRYSYSLFSRVRGRWYGPVTLATRTGARSGATEAAYVAKGTTLLPTALETVVLGSPDAGAHLVVRVDPAAGTPVVGGSVIVQPTASLPAGYIGVVQSISPTGIVTLSAAGLGDALERYSLHVAAFTSDEEALPLSTVKSMGVPAKQKSRGIRTATAASHAPATASSTALRHLSASSVVRPAARPSASSRLTCESDSAISPPELARTLGLGGSFDADGDLWRKSFSLDMQLYVAGEAKLHAEVSRSTTCSVRLPALTKTLQIGWIPIGVVLQPVAKLSLTGRVQVDGVGASIKAGFRVHGTGRVDRRNHLQLQASSNPIKEFNVITPTLDARVDIGLQLGGSLFVGPGAASDFAGVMAGIRGDLNLVDGRFALAAATDGSRSAICMGLQAGLSASLSLEARAWLHAPFVNFDASASVRLVGLENPIPYFAPVTIPSGCDPDAVLAQPVSAPSPTAAPVVAPSSEPAPTTAPTTAAPTPTDVWGPDDTTNGMRHVIAADTDEDLNCSLQTAEDDHGEYYSSTACGTFMGLGGSLYAPASVPAASSLSDQVTPTAWTPVSQTTSGSGSVADPWLRTTTVAAGDTGVRLVQQDRWVQNGSRVVSRMTLENTTGQAVPIRLYRAFDCYLAGSDSGTTSIDPATGTASCLTDASASPLALRLVADTAGATVAAKGFDDVWGEIGRLGDLSNTTAVERLDNGAGIGWSATLPAGSSVTFRSTVSVGAQ